MIDLRNIQPVQKGTLLLMCDVHVKPWKYAFKKVKVFEKGQSRWVALPTTQFTTKTGEVKYEETGEFDTPAILTSFRNQVMAIVDQYLASNPDLKVEDAVKEDDLCPF